MNIRELEEALSQYPEDTELSFVCDPLIFNHVVHSPAGVPGNVTLELVQKGAMGVINQRKHQGVYCSVRGPILSMLQEVYSAAHRFRYCKQFESQPSIRQAERDLLETVRKTTKVNHALQSVPTLIEKPCSPYQTLATSAEQNMDDVSI